MLLSHEDRRFLLQVGNEVKRARLKFPDPNCSMIALTEEVGELAKALLDEPWRRVREEAIQVAAMALRVALEKDPSVESYRQKRKEDARDHS